MELDTIQKVVGIIGGVVAILGTVFGIWRDFPKIQDRLPRRANNKQFGDKVINKTSPNVLAFTDYLFPIGGFMFLGGIAVILVGGVVSAIIKNSSFALFILRALLILCSGGGFFVGMGFISLLFDSNTISSKQSDLLWGVLFLGIGFGMIYLLIFQTP